MSKAKDCNISAALGGTPIRWSHSEGDAVSERFAGPKPEWVLIFVHEFRDYVHAHTTAATRSHTNGWF